MQPATRENTDAAPPAARPKPATLKVALVDPSLFTLPYDLKLVEGLRDIGHIVRFYGKMPGAQESAPPSAGLVPHFYPEMQRWGLAHWPHGAAKLAKGVLHVRAMRRLVEVLRWEQPDVIHFQWLPLPIIDQAFIGTLRAIAPIVLTAHDSLPFNTSPTSIIQTLGATSAIRHFDRVIVHTEQARRRLVSYGVEPGRIVRIAHGFLHDERTNAPAPRAEGTDEPVCFLMFGKIKHYKGADLAISAMQRMPADLRARAWLRIVGKPYIDIRPLERAAAELGASVTLDFRHVPDNEIAELWQRADVLLLPYREIDMSGVLMAALSAARPIVASEIGGFTELLENGRTALLVPPNDPDALSAAMSRLVREPATRRRLSQETRALAATVPSWQAIAAETAAVYTRAREARAAA